jgi:hypothetical protein
MRRETHGTDAARKHLHGDKCMYRLVASFVIGLCFATSLYAQEASLIGTVTDETKTPARSSHYSHGIDHRPAVRGSH